MVRPVEEATTVRVGVFGGTFDPIHVGHLILAEQCREQANLDEVLFVPAARPPHKQNVTLTSFERRAEMIALAISGQPAFRLNEMEKDRPGPSYTVDTLRILTERQPPSELFLILGSDAVHDLPGWRDPSGILRLATLLINARPGWDLPPLDTLSQTLGCREDAPVRAVVVHSPLVDISSRDIRQRLAAGKSIRYLVPRAVEAYIHDKKLWRVVS
jgi:nicotinate-nucleotide adenylyltransferase